MKILIIGGLGYTGSALTHELLKENNKITIIDTGWFGDYIINHKNLKKIKADIRDIKNIQFKNFEKVVHLANIANDPSVDLNPTLSWEVNVLATKQILEKCIKSKVKHFIYASSGSVYGIKKERNVTEDLSLDPISTYNKTKMISEKVIESYKDRIKYHIVRPATVCGYSPRMRLDVTVNMFVYQSFFKKKINIFGGSQVRPNINIKDLTNVYLHFIKNEKIKSGIFNAGFENLSILNIAKKIAKVTGCELKVNKNVNDARSYRQNSDKLIRTGFKQLYSVDYAIHEIYNKFLDKSLKPNKKSFTVNYMKEIGF